MREPLLAAQAFQRFGEPWTGGNLCPIRLRGVRIPVDGGVSARNHTHGFLKADAVLSGSTLDLAQLSQGAAQPLGIDFYPTSAYQSQALGLFEQFLNLGPCELLAVENDFQAKIEKRIPSQSRWWLATHCGRHLRAGRAIPSPDRRHTYDYPGTFQLWHIPQKLHRLRRPPAQRMEDLSRVNHGLQPGTTFGCSLHGKK